MGFNFNNKIKQVICNHNDIWTQDVLIDTANKMIRKFHQMHKQSYIVDDPNSDRPVFGKDEYGSTIIQIPEFMNDGSAIIFNIAIPLMYTCRDVSLDMLRMMNIQVDKTYDYSVILLRVPIGCYAIHDTVNGHVLYRRFVANELKYMFECIYWCGFHMDNGWSHNIYTADFTYGIFDENIICDVNKEELKLFFEWCVEHPEIMRHYRFNNDCYQLLFKFVCADDKDIPFYYVDIAQLDEYAAVWLKLYHKQKLYFNSSDYRKSGWFTASK